MNLIESERLYVRHYTLNDEEHFCRLNMDEDVMRYIRPVRSREDTLTFFRQVIANYQSAKPDLRLAMLEKATGAFVGSFAIIPVSNTPDTQLGYSILKEYWGKGYATEITKAGVDYVFNVIQLPEVYAVTEAPNTASQKVLLKSGFTFNRNYMEGEKELKMYVLKNPNN